LIHEHLVRDLRQGEAGLVETLGHTHLLGCRRWRLTTTLFSRKIRRMVDFATLKSSARAVEVSPLE
jgi:hypothetical protein